MPIDPRFVGRTYGPFVYEVSAQKIREFALAVGQGVPSLMVDPSDDVDPVHLSHDAARAAGFPALMAPPAFANVFAFPPFSRASMDPELEIEVFFLVHGEQAYEFVRPVFAGDTMTTVGRIASVTEKSGKDFMVVETESVNQRGELCVRGSFTAVVRRPG